MRASFHWLRELLPGLPDSPREVADRLTRVGLEVEGTLELGLGSEGIALVRVVGVEPHPSRERLRLVTVDAGGGATERVVCGAPNVPPPGHLVARAPLGARLGAIGLTLEPRDIGGVSSSGMLVSEAELGLADESDGILVWEPGAAAEGTPLRQLLPAAYDTIFEIGITPNRPDALGHLGLARDLAAVYGLPAPAIESPPLALAPGPTGHVTVELADRERCPLYTGALVQGVAVGPSPAWLRHRLHLLGIRPISNVVDVTNLVLLERGQPMHGFDATRIGGGRVVVRRATPGEALRTLDGVERRLDPDDLVIADGSGPTALAGVMGGGDSEIRAETRDVFLECAYFQPRGVRRTSRRHGLSTESSYRFERGVDPGGVEPALARAASLLASLAGGRVFAPGTVARGELPAPPRMRLRSSTLDATLGVPVPFDEARAVLERLGFRVSGAPGALELEVAGASFRPDVTREIDLVEEVARIRGLDGIPARIPALAPESADDPLALERAALREAAALGLSEAVTYSFSSPEELARVHAPPPAVSLRNPMSEDRRALRTSLLPGLLDAARRARRRGEPSVRLFTIGARFLPPAEAPRPRSAEDAVLPGERRTFAAVLAGARPGHLGRAEELDVLDATGLAVELVERLLRRPVELRPFASPARPSYLHPRGAAEILVADRSVGALGPLHPDVADAVELPGAVQVVELDLDALTALGVEAPRFRPIPRLPANSRDVAVVVDSSLPAGELARRMREAAGPLCESVELFDLFTGGAIPEGKRSLAYRLVYRDPRAATQPEGARTLTDEEVDREHARVRALAESLGELRS